MRISSKTRYSIKVLVYMAIIFDSNEYIALNEISKSTNISAKYLERLLGKLRNASIIDTHRGAAGGYRINKSTSEITLFDVVCAVEDDVLNVDCLSEKCNNKKCIGKNVFENLKSDISHTLKKYTIEEIIKNNKGKDK